MKSVGRTIWKWSAATFAGVVLLLAVGVGLFRLVAPMVPEYRQQAEREASVTLGLPVQIRSMDVVWHGLGPELVLRQARILTADGKHTVVEARQVRLGINVVDLVHPKQLVPDRVILVDPVLRLVHEKDGSWTIPGLDIPSGGDAWRQILKRTLGEVGLEVRGGRLDITDHQHPDSARYVFNDMALQLSGDESDYRLEGSTRLPEQLGDTLEFSVTATGPASRPEEWRWQGRLGVHGLRVEPFADRLLPKGAAHLGGRADLDVHARATGLEPEAIGGNATVTGLGERPDGAVMAGVGGPPDHVDFTLRDLDWHATATGWRLAATHLQVTRGQVTWPATQFSLEKVRSPGAAGATYYANDGFARLQDVALVAGWLPPDLLPGNDWLVGLAPQGEMHDLALQMRVADGAVPVYSCHASLANAGVRAFRKVPGVSGLNGELTANQAGGRLQMTSNDLQLVFPTLFRDPLQASELAGTLQWERRGEDWWVSADKVKIANRDARVDAHGSLRFPGEGGKPVIDLEADIHDADAASKSTYLPVGIMPDPLVEWLDNSIVSGTVPEGHAIIRGPLDKFPWKQGGGLFDIKFHVDRLHLAYQPDWPAVTGLSLDAEFRGNGLTASGTDGTTEGLAVQSFSAQIPDFHDAVLSIKSHAQGSASQMLDFIRHSPLNARFGGYLQALQMQGDAPVDLSLTLPLKHIADSEVDGQVHLDGFQAQLDGLPAPLEQVSGDLGFTRDGLDAPELEGRFLGQPIRGSIRSVGGPHPGARVDVTGRHAVKTVTDAFKLPVGGRVTGETNWRVTASIPRRNGESNAEPLSVTVHSDLKGVAVHLPAPLGKSEDAARISEATLRFPDGGGMEVSAAYGEAASARLIFAHEGKGPTPLALQKGNLHLGPEPAAWPRFQGLSVTGKLDRLVVEEWLALADKQTKKGATAGALAGRIGRVNVTIGQLDWLNQSFHDQQVLARSTQAGWRLALDGPGLEGLVWVPASLNGSQAVLMDMQRVKVAVPAADKDTDNTRKTPPDPRDFPSVHLRANRFLLGDTDFGSVEATLQHRNDGLHLLGLDAAGGTFTGHLAGEWVVSGGEQVTRLDGRVDSTDAEATLKQLGYQAGLDADKASLTAQLSVPGPPVGAILPRLNGTVHIQMSDGRLLDVAPGAGRIFGLLSISALPRRLLLDFSDVFSKGFSFDELSGDFLLDSGNAYTSNLQLKGPAARIHLVGRTGLVDHDYDQTAVVDASLSSSLPLVGAIAGGAGVGAAVYLLSKLFKHPLEDLSRIEYHITGNWNDPTVERIRPEKKADAKKP
ncbi:MAG: YhdP family protein [Gammaproteobacteria bacterium]|jgi:uncharacterized protein (TIGR02099 family)